MKKHLTPLNLIFALQIIVILLVVLGLAPKELVLVFSGLVVFWLIFSPLQDGLLYFLASIPLFVALPIAESFDQMANWRIFLSVLFLVWFFRNYKTIWSWVRKNANLKSLKSINLATLSILFLILAILSLTQASHLVAGIKRILFLLNIVLLFFVVHGFCQNQAKIISAIKALAVGAITVLAVALIQLVFVFIKPLYAFWQFWAKQVINLFYGSKLAELLSYSNTWFAYYENRPPTLRVFSVFPDSHSLAMFCLLTIPIFLVLAIYYQRKGKRTLYKLFWTGLGLSLLAVVLSGSRGAWLSFVPAIIVAICIFRRKVEPYFSKKVLVSVGLFLLMFLISFGYPLLLYKFQSLQGGGEQIDMGDFFRFLERTKSISDIGELSNLGRLQIWDRTIDSFASHPWLGVGMGNYPLVLEEDISAGKKGASAHNLYLEIGNEMGIFGMLILILLFLAILKIAWTVFRKSQNNYLKIFGLAFGLYFIWILGYSLFDVVLLNDKVLLLFVGMVAILYSCKRSYCSSLSRTRLLDSGRPQRPSLEG